MVDLEPGDLVCGAAALEGEAPIMFEGMLAFVALLDRLRLAAHPELRSGPER